MNEIADILTLRRSPQTNFTPLPVFLRNLC